ncbi:putative helicase [Ereboglobus sp. PH5-10]|uniref:DEAD/DEAH box helicase n=1 Tax=Ereboglobus sp. PH5-10 TaxID=2940629 RepID=UPI00240528D3|nr:type ISP restriction/modification enzyme [Ereboglobus sp. PH5-10]MDF9827486.1 putative helicase [Ereboglobus sp. PH5-10]
MSAHNPVGDAVGRRDFKQLLETFRSDSANEREKGARFERLMQRFLKTDPTYEGRFKHVWLWNEFPFRADLGGKDTGIDLVAQDTLGDYWAVQCKCYAADARIDKAEVDSFLSTASRSFVDDSGRTAQFAHCLWISTTDNWGKNAEEAIHNRIPPVSRISPAHLQNSAVDWDKLARDMSGEKARKPAHQPKPHQLDAISAAKKHFSTADRGQLIMACGTGKTFTSLKIAETFSLENANSAGTVLFLVPSISLLGQTLDEWSAHAAHPIKAICICSDPEVSKKKTKDEDSGGFSVVDLALPASTDAHVILRQLDAATNTPGLTVIFSTYQSISVVAKAQKAWAQKVGQNRAIFDLIICDEAHRTTGVTLADEDESAFVRVHDNAFVSARRRLYMTATPRLYHETAKKIADENDMVLCSMDDESLYGPQFYHIGFGEAVQRGLLSDYKVLILTVNDGDLPEAAQKMIAAGKTEIPAADINKLIGCINALSKQIVGDKGITRQTDPALMRTAVAFCQNIKTSKQITATLNQMGELYYKTLSADAREKLVTVSSDHVDGTMAAPTREQKLSWLKSPGQNTAAANPCHILTNVRCLSEGVDVPTLDAVMFLSARNSQVDVVQSVGRVMRRAPDKKYGYIIIPIVTPTDVSGEKALGNNPAYAVVWTVLNALRAHDDRFAATVNKIELNRNKPLGIVIGGAAHGEAETTDGTERVGKGAHEHAAGQLTMRFDQMQSLLYAKLVEKVGERRYWEQWAKDVAQIAEREIKNITALVKNSPKHHAAFGKFLGSLQKNINPSVNAASAIEMLAQHLITQPVFEALFENYSFVQNNPVSKEMTKMLFLLRENRSEDDDATLVKFYDSVRQRAADIDNAEAKQAIIVELYDKFFRNAFPKMVEQLGIVYTPVPVVDFIIHSVAAVLEKEFARKLDDENIHILDPFTGTGTFITRLLQSGHISQKNLLRKYKKEIHANEIVLLPYYIASVNIENVFHDLANKTGGTSDYVPFDGICLTDTFQLGETKESEDFLDEIFPANSARVRAQRKAPLRIIVGNPPYSVGQKSANDNAQNQAYPKLEKRIADTYVAASDATNKNALYDSYIKAFRWSTDRLDPEHGGIICFVSNGAWLDGNSTAGFRLCLENEFSAIYVFNLRGNQRTSGELSRKEGGKIFGSGSRTPISITLLVKKPRHQGKAIIHYHDIGDYLSRDEKLSIIQKFHDLAGADMPWKTLLPNEHGDWINHRNDAFDSFIPLDSEKKFDAQTSSVFTTYSSGLKTQRDAWAYSSSQEQLRRQMNGLIDFYNGQVAAFQTAVGGNPKLSAEEFVEKNAKKISWSRALFNGAQKGNVLKKDGRVVRSMYRPFFAQYLYSDKNLNEMTYRIPQLFPTSETENIVICVPGLGGNKESSCFITNITPDIQLMFNGQCFPLYWYEDLRKKEEATLFDQVAEPQAAHYARRDGISDSILQRVRKNYGSKTTKEDVFYYVYALLHNPDYRQTFSADLKKSLPRIPLVEDSAAFWKYTEVGRELAELHLHYEDYAHEATERFGVIQLLEPTTKADVEKSLAGKKTDYLTYAVTKMRFEKNGKEDDKTAIRYNEHRVIRNIPVEAYEYIVNGKSAIEWIMERYQITTHKESGIVNDPNDWAREHEQPAYMHNLLLSVIAVSMQTVQIVKSLPKVEFK